LVGELTLPGNGFTLPLPAHLRERMSGMVGRHVVLGLRPEHLLLRPDAGPDCGEEGAAPINVKFNVIEPLGSDMDIYMSTNLHDHVVGRVEAQVGLQTDAAATVYVANRRVHFFEPGETGMNLSLVKESAHAVA
jgi:hypothetical protein